MSTIKPKGRSQGVKRWWFRMYPGKLPTTFTRILDERLGRELEWDVVPGYEKLSMLQARYTHEIYLMIGTGPNFDMTMAVLYEAVPVYQSAMPFDGWQKSGHAASDWFMTCIEKIKRDNTWSARMKRRWAMRGKNFARRLGTLVARFQPWRLRI